MIDQLIMSDDTLPLPDKGGSTHRGREADSRGTSFPNQSKKTSIPLKELRAHPFTKQDTAQTLGSPISPDLVRLQHQFSIEKTQAGLALEDAIHLPAFQLNI